MKYLTTENCALFAYDEKSGFTLRFCDGKWELSPVVLNVLEHDGFYTVPESMAMEKTGGISPYGVLADCIKLIYGD